MLLGVDVGGTFTDAVQRFLRAGLIQRLIVTRVPVLIGEGIPLFGTLPHDVRLERLEILFQLRAQPRIVMHHQHAVGRGGPGGAGPGGVCRSRSR